MAKQEKCKANDYSRLNQCNTRKFASSIRPLSYHKGITKSFLAVSPLFTSRTKKEEENRDPENARQACVTILSHPHALPVRLPLRINPMVVLIVWMDNS